jgi:hypothetical protein
MRFFFILFCLLLAFLSNAKCSDLIKLREEYMLSKNNLESCIKLNNLSKYCNPKLEPVKYSYNIISNLMQCNFILNPFSKYKIFKNSTQKLDSLILLNPKHTEIRFLRYLVQLNCPRFLLYDAHIDDDLKLIMSNIQSEPKDLQNFIYNIINH